nr:MAG TPA: hypothetical protein [Caudoviricetes sp.]
MGTPYVILMLFQKLLLKKSFRLIASLKVLSLGTMPIPTGNIQRYCHRHQLLKNN